MNEKIKLLWKQAGGSYDSGNQHTWPQYVIDNPQKFVELIVRECVDVCESMQLIGPYKTVQDATLKDAAVQIKEHFGVEP